MLRTPLFHFIPTSQFRAAPLPKADCRLARSTLLHYFQAQFAQRDRPSASRGLFPFPLASPPPHRWSGRSEKHEHDSSDSHLSRQIPNPSGFHDAQYSPKALSAISPEVGKCILAMVIDNHLSRFHCIYCYFGELLCCQSRDCKKFNQ